MEDRRYWTPTPEEVAGAEREALESAVTALLPNHLRDDRVASYEDLLDALEGPFRRASGEWVDLDLGDSTDGPAYKAILRLARRVVRESTR